MPLNQILYIDHRLMLFFQLTIDAKVSHLNLQYLHSIHLNILVMRCYKLCFLQRKLQLFSWLHKLCQELKKCSLLSIICLALKLFDYYLLFKKSLKLMFAIADLQLILTKVRLVNKHHIRTLCSSTNY